LKRIALFDMDGTLVDSMYQWARTPSNVLFQFGYQTTDEDEEMIKRLGYFKCPAYLIEKYHLECTELEYIERGFDLMLEQYRSFVLMRPNAKNYLESLHEKGVKIVIMTASKGRFIDIMAEKFGLSHLIDARYSARDMNTEKSCPLIFETMFRDMNCTGSDCIMFEDAHYALEMAAKLGIDGVGVFDPMHAKQHEGLRKVAVRCVENYGELLEQDVFEKVN